MSDNIRVYGASVKDKLNPDIWSGERLKNHVREALLKIADKFHSFTNIDLKVVNVFLTGASASYNWVANSDINIHLVYDFSEFSSDENKQETLRRKFNSQKRIFNDLYELEIYGHDVIIGVEHVDDYNISEGIFSLKENVWIRKPSKEEPDINRERIRKRVKYFMNVIDRLEFEESNIDTFENAMRIKDEILNMKGASESDTFSFGNVVLKTLQSSGYINKLLEYITDSYSEITSLKEGKQLKSIYLIAESLGVHQKHKLSEFDFTLIEEVEIGEYDLVLIELSDDYKDYYDIHYQIGLQKRGRDFISIEDQFKVEPVDSIDRTVIPKMVKKIKEWRSKYNKISIGSFNTRKTLQYKRFLNYFNIPTKTKQFEDNNIYLVIV